MAKNMWKQKQVTIDTGIQLANGVFDSSTFLVHVVHDHSNIFAEVAQWQKNLEVAD